MFTERVRNDHLCTITNPLVFHWQPGYSSQQMVGLGSVLYSCSITVCHNAKFKHDRCTKNSLSITYRNAIKNWIISCCSKMYSLGQFNKCSTVGTHYCWDCLRWCDVVRSSTTAAAWRLVSRRRCSSRRRCRTRSEPNRSLHPSDQTQSESVYLRTQRSTGSPSGLKKMQTH